MIDHKTTIAPDEALPEIAKHYTGQLAAYAEALKRVTEKSVIENWINFASMGAMVRVDFE